MTRQRTDHGAVTGLTSRSKTANTQKGRSDASSMFHWQSPARTHRFTGQIGRWHSINRHQSPSSSEHPKLIDPVESASFLKSKNLQHFKVFITYDLLTVVTSLVATHNSLQHSEQPISPKSIVRQVVPIWGRLQGKKVEEAVRLLYWLIVSALNIRRHQYAALITALHANHPSTLHRSRFQVSNSDHSPGGPKDGRTQADRT